MREKQVYIQNKNEPGTAEATGAECEEQEGRKVVI